MDEGYIDLNPAPPKIAPLSQSRRTAALDYVRRALAQTAPLAIKFQRELIEEARESEDVRLKKLGLDASESILDRFMGRATQEIRVGETKDRPIVFDARLKVLQAGMQAAVEAASNLEESAVDAFAREVTKGNIDTGGVVI